MERGGEADDGSAGGGGREARRRDAGGCQGIHARMGAEESQDEVPTTSTTSAYMSSLQWHRPTHPHLEDDEVHKPRKSIATITGRAYSVHLN